jgi:hypothetical protein
MAEASSDVLPLVIWLSTMEPWERITLVLIAVVLVLATLARLPALGQFVAQVFGRGETARERDLAGQVATLTHQVAVLEGDIGLILQALEEQLTGIEALMEQATCLDPSGQCALAANVAAMRELAARWRQSQARFHERRVH